MPDKKKSKGEYKVEVTAEPDFQLLVQTLLAKALSESKSDALVGAAKQAADDYSDIVDALAGFPNRQKSEKDPRWKLPPLSPRADTTP